MSLRDGSKKMSKSDPSDYSRINLTDDDDAIAQKIRKAKTDPLPLPETVKELEARPEAENLVGIFAALTDTTPEAVLRQHTGSQFSEFKREFIDVAIAKMGPMRAEMLRLAKAPDHIDAVLADGAKRARAIARPIIDAAKDILGLVRAR
jgi:tryptophanyl-tRNA synthetase